MRHRYAYLDPELIRSLGAAIDLLRLFNQLLLAAAGDAGRAREWLRELQERGYLDDNVDLDAFFAELEEQGLVRAGGADGGFTAAGARQLRRSAFEEVLASLTKAGPGYHSIHAVGEGMESLPETRPYAFGARATGIELADIPGIQAGPFHTNTCEALALARTMLAGRRNPNKQLFLITDGTPSAVTEARGIYKNPYGLDLKIVDRTLEDADRCRRQKIVITTFMIATDPTLQ